MKIRTLALTFLMLCASAAAAPQTWVLTRAEWAGPLNAQRVIALVPVRNAVHALNAAPGSRLLVAHNGGEEGLFWASNLEGWLVALGVPAARIVDRSAGVPPDEIHLELLPGAAGAP